jgi:hypothetical protein
MMLDLELGIDVAETALDEIDTKLDVMNEWLAMREKLAGDEALRRRLELAVLPYLRKFPVTPADTDYVNEEIRKIAEELRARPTLKAAAADAADGVRERTPVEKIAWKLRLSDWIFDLVVLLIAVILGISVLWVTDATWGGVEDYIPAFLWGLGLHAVSASTFQGFGGLRQRFANPTPPDPQQQQ